MLLNPNPIVVVLVNYNSILLAECGIILIYIFTAFYYFPAGYTPLLFNIILYRTVSNTAIALPGLLLKLFFTNFSAIVLDVVMPAI